MNPDRLPFTVELIDADRAMIGMNCGHGVVRARTMPLRTLHDLGRLCRGMLAKAEEILLSELKIPSYPRFLSVVTGEVDGICHAKLGLHRLDNGTVEQTIAIYDEGDNEAPVLVLVEEQIEQFIEQALRRCES